MMMKAFVDELLKIKLAQPKLVPKGRSIGQRGGSQFVSAKTLPGGKPIGMRGGPTRPRNVMPQPKGLGARVGPRSMPKPMGKLTGRLSKGLARGAKALILKR